MPLWSDRMALASKGWTTQVRINTRGVSKGNVALGFWARRLHWTGWIGDICLHAHAVVARDEATPGLFDGLSAKVREACERAETDFPESIPCQLPDLLPDGRIALAENAWETRHAQASGRRDAFPSECLFGAELIPDRGIHAAVLLDASRRIEVGDSLDYYAEARFARDCHNRRWTYRFRPCVTESAGVRVASRHEEFSVSILDEAFVGDLVKDGTTRLVQLFADYGRNGVMSGMTPNGLPPGYQTLEEKLRPADPDQEQEDRST